MHPPQRSLRLLASLATLGVVAATFAAPGGASAQATDSAWQRAYAAAAQEFGVPVDVLLGVSYLESRWDTNAGQLSTSGGFGPMHLTDAAAVAALPTAADLAGAPEDTRSDDSRATKTPIEQATPGADAIGGQTLDAAASLTGLSKEALRSDAAANIRGGGGAAFGVPEGIDGTERRGQ
jgi:hypothetical protein